jgi:hypothetical protein
MEESKEYSTPVGGVAGVMGATPTFAGLAVRPGYESAARLTGGLAEPPRRPLHGPRSTLHEDVTEFQRAFERQRGDLQALALDLERREARCAELETASVARLEQGRRLEYEAERATAEARADVEAAAHARDDLAALVRPAPRPPAPPAGPRASAAG